jgi:multiple antibiotic resistance protein
VFGSGFDSPTSLAPRSPPRPQPRRVAWTSAPCPPPPGRRVPAGVSGAVLDRQSGRGSLIFHQAMGGRTRAETRLKLARQIALLRLLHPAGLAAAGRLHPELLRRQPGRPAGGRRPGGGDPGLGPADGRPRSTRTARPSQAESAQTQAEDMAFFPLTMPFTTGPGSISVAIALSSQRPTEGSAVAPVLHRREPGRGLGGDHGLATLQRLGPSCGCWASRARGCSRAWWPSCCCASASRSSPAGVENLVARFLVLHHG